MGRIAGRFVGRFTGRSAGRIALVTREPDPQRWPGISPDRGLLTSIPGTGYLVLKPTERKDALSVLIVAAGALILLVVTHIGRWLTVLDREIAVFLSS